METQFDIKEILTTGAIGNELDLERALIADRKLRLLAKGNEEFKKTRKRLRDIIADYEEKHWSIGSEISNSKLEESDLAETIAEQERLFIENRKQRIRFRLKSLGLNQQQLGDILGHRSKTHMSELMNGIRPFTLRDLIIINRLLNIELKELVPTFLPSADRLSVKSSLKKLDNPKLKLSRPDLSAV